MRAARFRATPASARRSPRAARRAPRAYPHRTRTRARRFLTSFCTATVLSIRDELLEANDFAFAVKALQRFEGRVPMHALLAKAIAIYREDYPEPAASDS